MSADLRPKWLNFTRYLQKAACKNAGIAVVSSQVVVGSDGNPITWTEPSITRLGPLSSQDELIKLLAAHAEPREEKEFLLAEVLDGRRIVINKGMNDGVAQQDWFTYIDNAQPYAILVVEELKERIAILRTIWVDSQSSNVVKKGHALNRLSW